MAKSKTEYLVKVSLSGDKGIWRTIAIRGDRTLHELHGVIFVAFERYDNHLYSFYFPKIPDRLRQGQAPPKEFTAPEMLNESDPFNDIEKFNAAETTLDSLELEKGQTFEYVFDFGDYWEHELSIEDFRPAETGSEPPCIVESQGEAPPQYPDYDDENYIDEALDEEGSENN